MVGIYKITNLITNKVYIGQSIDINKRKYSNTKIEQRDVSTNKVIKVFDNLYAISSSLRGKYDKNFCARIIRVCNKKEKTACGYIWTFEDSND